MNTQKAIKVIDTVVAGITEETINTAFVEAALYGKLDIDTYKHILDKWESKDNDFFDFYLNSSEQRALLEALNIEVEPDKYPDYDSRIMAELRDGKSRSEIYPFETELIRSFFIFCYNNGLDILKKVSPSAWHTVIENNINPYGNYLNWSLFWSKAILEDKELLLNYIETTK